VLDVAQAGERLDSQGLGPGKTPIEILMKGKWQESQRTYLNDIA
jgi:hypothetical protein